MDNPNRFAVTRSLCLWLVLVTILAAGLRLPRLGSWSMWEDELYTARTCSHLFEVYLSKRLGYVPTAAALWLSGVDPLSIPSEQPEQWRAMGVTEFPMRIASCLIGIATIPLLGLAGARLLGARAAGIAALLLAIAPWHIYWSQAARFYTQQFLFYNLALIFYFVATQHGSRPRLVWAMVFAVLGFLSQPPALVIAAIFAADWLIALLRGRPVRLGRSGWLTLIIALGACVVIVGYDIASDVHEWGKLGKPLGHTPSVLVLGTVWQVTPALAAFAVLSGLAIWRHHSRLAIYLLLAAVVPAAVLVIMYLGFENYVHTRYAFVSLYAWVALAAVGLDRILSWRRADHHASAGSSLVGWAVIAAVIVPVLVVDFEYFAGGNAWRRRWKEAFAYIEQHRQPGEAVLAERLDIARYYLEDADVQRLPGKVENLPPLDRPTWLIAATESATGKRRYTFLDDLADLRAYYDVRIVQPFSSIRVYYNDGARPAGHDAAAIGR